MNNVKIMALIAHRIRRKSTKKARNQICDALEGLHYIGLSAETIERISDQVEEEVIDSMIERNVNEYVRQIMRVPSSPD